jgi:hypothetical protein
MEASTMSRRWRVLNPAIWTRCRDRLPPENVVVETRVSDHRGISRSRFLKRVGRLWFVPDGSDFVNRPPTHWKLRET